MRLKAQRGTSRTQGWSLSLALTTCTTTARPRSCTSYLMSALDTRGMGICLPTTPRTASRIFTTRSNRSWLKSNTLSPSCKNRGEIYVAIQKTSHVELGLAAECHQRSKRLLLHPIQGLRDYRCKGRSPT